VKNYKKIAVAILATLGVSLLSGNAQSLNLSGGSVVGSLTNQELIGSSPPYLGANFGTVSSWVVSDTSLDSSGLIFIYQIVNNGPDVMTSAAFPDFSSAFVSADTFSNIVGSVSLGGSAVPSTSGSFSFYELSAGGAATFQTGGLPNGDTPSWFLVVDSDDNSIQHDYGTTQDTYTSYGNILAPIEVPEPPASLVLLGGLVCLYGLIKCRRQAQG
jgi:hypothetical protein